MWISSLTTNLPFDAPDFVLRVHEDQAARGGGWTPRSYSLKQIAGHVVERPASIRPSAMASSRRDRPVVLLELGRGRQDGLVELLVLLQPLGQAVAAEAAHALLVVVPGGGLGDAGDVAAHDELERKLFALAHDHDVRVGHVDDVVGHDVPRLLEPEGGDLVQHLALERNGAEDAVERGDPVGRDEDAAAALLVAVADLALLPLADSPEVAYSPGRCPAAP